jgi:hypothetical protein
LAEQIALKKQALAKSETVDKSSPTLEAPKDAPKAAAAAPTASSGGGGGGDFQSELLARMKARVSLPKNSRRPRTNFNVNSKTAILLSHVLTQLLVNPQQQLLLLDLPRLPLVLEALIQRLM